MISFRRNDYKQIQILYKEANDYNTIQTDIKVESGDLVLFPSNICFSTLHEFAFASKSSQSSILTIKFSRFGLL
jgi:hypothetical protein